VNGFASRLDDLDRLASLGISRMRFPILWERTAPHSPGIHDWAWTDQRLERLKELSVLPIAGLLHHGSGPLFTHLLDPSFPQLLANYAAAVADRYPHIDAYTPVNEPLTTARFSGLYGVWYPHHSEDASFVRALLNEVSGTVLAMRAIRRVNPGALLVQTEDLGYCHSSPRLAYQARFENLRRWLSFDLLAGRVDRRHRLWPYLRRWGASEAELRGFQDEPCIPDIIGINTYVTSERLLDERTELYPAAFSGGNRRDRYTDIEAVRVTGNLIGGFESRLREACERYRLPVAITEAHLGCTREEQLRWLHQAWQSAQKVRSEGHDVRAVTCWATFGSFDWHTLVTRQDGRYEPGLWDVRSTPPRATALATLAGQLARSETPSHPVLDGPGWWQRSIRILYPPYGEVQSIEMAGRPILITGGKGTLAQELAIQCEVRGLPSLLLSRESLDIADPQSIEAILAQSNPWAVINTAGYVRVDDAEHDVRQWRENAEGPTFLAKACARHGVRFVTFSSDLVFGGEHERAAPYRESDAPSPLNEYGRAKAHAEYHVLKFAPDALVIRTAAFFGPRDRHNFITLALEALRSGKVFTACQDQWTSPTYVPDLVHATLDLLVDGESGIWHLTNLGAVSWSEFARLAARSAGLDSSLVRAMPTSSLGQVAARPRYAALVSERGDIMPTLEDALSRYSREVERHQTNGVNFMADQF
jgi:dTDP-4-dehydrorhamnose reductase